MKGFSYLVKEGFRNVWSNRIMSIASVCVLISCLVLTGAAALFSMNVSKLVDEVGESNETMEYMSEKKSKRLTMSNPLLFIQRKRRLSSTKRLWVTAFLPGLKKTTRFPTLLL